MASEFQENTSVSVLPLLLDPLGKLLTENVTLKKLSVAADYLAGRLMGKITTGGDKSAAVTSAGAGAEGALTGDGSLTMDATAPFTDTATLGVYTAKCSAKLVADPSAPSEWGVYAPNGAYLGLAKAGTAFDNQVKFTIADGSTAFELTDIFYITLSQATNADEGKIVEYDPDATDGSQVVYGILGNDVTVGTSSDVTGTFIYLRGLFNKNCITAKDGVVVANLKDELRPLSIYLNDVATEV
jgi:hypothetical protein